MYLTYEEYQSMGGTLDETAFNDFEFQARSYIDWYTFSRLKKYPEAVNQEEVKRCMYQLISIADKKKQSFSLGQSLDGTVESAISSQSNDGVSISFNNMSAVQVFESCDKEISFTIARCLDGVTYDGNKKLLYRGVYPNE